MRKSIQIQFEIIITPSFFLCNASSMHPAGLLGPEETTRTTRILKSYVYGEITDDALAASTYNIRDGIADALINLDASSCLLR